MLTWIRVVLLIGTLSGLVASGTPGQTSSLKKGLGQEWLSWTAAQQTRYVGAYLQGYLMGKMDACEAAVELFERGKKFTDLEQDPDRRCFRHAKGYSRPAGEYVKLITVFYARHPEHRDIPVEYFLLLFTDNRYSTLAAIEQGIRKGDVRTIF